MHSENRISHLGLMKCIFRASANTLNASNPFNGWDAPLGCDLIRAPLLGEEWLSSDSGLDGIGLV